MMMKKKKLSIDSEDFLLAVDFHLHGKQNSAEGEERLSSDPDMLENSGEMEC